MFDVGFQELLLVGLVALVVIGPERLPKVARIAGMWVGRARRTLASVQQEINRELKAEELKRVIEEQSRTNPLETILEDWPKTTSTPESTAAQSSELPKPAPPKPDEKTHS